MHRVVGYAVAGGILLVIADIAPGFAVGTASLILLGVALTKSNQLAVISKFISQNTGG